MLVEDETKVPDKSLFIDSCFRTNSSEQLWKVLELTHTHNLHKQVIVAYPVSMSMTSLRCEAI